MVVSFGLISGSSIGSSVGGLVYFCVLGKTPFPFRSLLVYVAPQVMPALLRMGSFQVCVDLIFFAYHPRPMVDPFTEFSGG